MQYLKEPPARRRKKYFDKDIIGGQWQKSQSYFSAVALTLTRRRSRNGAFVCVVGILVTEATFAIRGGLKKEVFETHTAQHSRAKHKKKLLVPVFATIPPAIHPSEDCDYLHSPTERTKEPTYDFFRMDWGSLKHKIYRWINKIYSLHPSKSRCCLCPYICLL